jgi:hypothetical protein
MTGVRVERFAEAHERIAYGGIVRGPDGGSRANRRPSFYRLAARTS